MHFVSFALCCFTIFAISSAQTIGKAQTGVDKRNFRNIFQNLWRNLWRRSDGKPSNRAKRIEGVPYYEEGTAFVPDITVLLNKVLGEGRNELYDSTEPDLFDETQSEVAESYLDTAFQPNEEFEDFDVEVVLPDEDQLEVSIESFGVDSETSLDWPSQETEITRRGFRGKRRGRNKKNRKVKKARKGKKAKEAKEGGLGHPLVHSLVDSEVSYLGQKCINVMFRCVAEQVGKSCDKAIAAGSNEEHGKEVVQAAAAQPSEEHQTEIVQPPWKMEVIVPDVEEEAVVEPADSF